MSALVNQVLVVLYSSSIVLSICAIVVIVVVSILFLKVVHVVGHFCCDLRQKVKYGWIIVCSIVVIDYIIHNESLDCLD
eukprot:2131414-Amphidinium_carterae.1